RHHVGHGAERDEVDQIEKVGLWPQHMPVTAAAQLTVYGDNRDERDADRGEMAEPRHVVEPVRVYDRERRRQRFVGLMVVEDDGVEAKLTRPRERCDAGCAAIDGHEQLRALFGERLDRGRVRPITLEQAVGNMDQRLAAGGAEKLGQYRSRRRTV